MDLDAALAATEPSTQPRAAHPKGWEPGYTTAGTTATGVYVAPEDQHPDEAMIVRGMGLDPDDWAIVGNVNVRRWQTYDERWLRYYKCDVVRRRAGDRPDVNALCKLAASRKVTRPKPRTDDGWVSFVSLNDWQIGKGEGGGTPATVDFLMERFARLEDLWKRDKPAVIYLGNTGDLSEAVTGHYPSQAFTVDLDQREQDRVARRLVFRVADIAARCAPRVILSGVPCNHGENRGPSGKMQTRVTDNKSLTYVENVAEAMAMNPDAYGHVEFEYADDSGVLVADLAGVTTGLTHGHQFDRGSGTSMSKVVNWWTGQIKGLRPVSAAVLLMTAHKHHFEVSEEIGRTAMIAPACDGGSGWWTNMTGQESPRGLLTVKVGTGIGNPLEGQRCWDDLKVL